MAKKRLLVDMDGTLARFHDQDMYLERMYEKNFFLDLAPFQNMVDAVRDIVVNHPEVEVFIVSAKVIGEPPYCVAEKNAWLDKYLPEIDANHRIFTDMGKSKAEYMPGGVTKDDYLMDDYNKGLNLFLADGGSAIKVKNNINMRGLGAYGGDKGVMWTGSLVTTEADPVIITGDILECMGLQRDRQAELAHLKMSGIPSVNANRYSLSGVYLQNSHMPPVYISNNPKPGSPFCCASFGDAVKYLDAHRRGCARDLNAFSGQRIPMRDPNRQGENIVIPNWQLEAICTNLKRNPLELLAGVDEATMQQIKKEIAHGEAPVYGKMDFTIQAPDNSAPIECREVFHDPIDLHDAYQQCKESPYTSDISVEWFVEPTQEQKNQILSSELNSMSEPWELTDDSCLQYRRALDPLGANDSFELCQIVKLPNDEYGICRSGVFNLSTMPEDKLNDYLRLYGFDDLEDLVRQGSDSCTFIYDIKGKIDRENSPDWIVDYGFIAEMVFETDWMEYLDDSRTYTWPEAIAEIARITGDQLALEHTDPIPATLSDMVRDAKAIQERQSCAPSVELKRD